MWSYHRHNLLAVRHKRTGTAGVAQQDRPKRYSFSDTTGPLTKEEDADSTVQCAYSVILYPRTSLQVAQALLSI